MKIVPIAFYTQKNSLGSQQLNCKDERELLLTVFVVFEKVATGNKPDDYA